MAASNRSGRGVGLRRNGVQLLGYRGLLVVALVFVTATTFVIENAHCSITTDAVAPVPTLSKEPTQPNVTFNQYEADALNAVFQQWTKQNPQLSTLLNWSLERHPCDNFTGTFEDSTGNNEESLGIPIRGAWIGVGCSAVLRNLTEIPKHYHVFVSSLTILGSNSGCSERFIGRDQSDQCGFDGIIGQLPPEISNLTNLYTLWISSNPKLTGPVPVEILQLPNVTYISLNNNSLSGSLPSDAVYNPDCRLTHLDLSNNDFSGSLRLSSQGTFFCSSLEVLYLNNNSLSGSLPSDEYNPACRLTDLDLSNNNFSGSLRVSSQGTFFCSSLQVLNVGFNQLQGPINLQDWNATGNLVLFFGNNRFGGTFSTSHYFKAATLDLSCNNFINIQFSKYIAPTSSNGLEIGVSLQTLSSLNISYNNFSGPFLKEIFQYPGLVSL